MKIHDNKGVFDSPNTQIVDSFNIYQQKPPPSDHPNAITCVQCDGLTWRMTDRCIHCNFDMAAHTKEQQHLQQLEQLRLEYHELRGKAIPLMVAIAVCLIALALTIFLAPNTPYLYWAILAIMMIIALFIKPRLEKMEAAQQRLHAHEDLL